MTEWQPIETAPKDGTSILVCGGTIIWTEGMGFEAEMGEPRIACWTGEYWYIGNGETYGDEIYCKPTNWMPLPAPPTAS